MGLFTSRESTPEEKNEECFGHIPDTYNRNDPVFTLKDYDTKVKKSFSLQEFFPNVYEQKSLNSSTACAIASVIEYIQKKTSSDTVVSPSILYLYYLGRYPDHTQLNVGTSIRKTLTLMNKYGIKDSKEIPYIVEYFTAQINIKDTQKNVYQGLFDFKKVPQDPKIIKAVLSIYEKPIIFGFNVYESFKNILKWDNDGKMPIPKENEKLLGSQTAVCVGYSEKKNAFLIRNSWGNNWKNDGYFFMPYDYFCSRDSFDFWTLDIISNLEFDGFVETKTARRSHKKKKKKRHHHHHHNNDDKYYDQEEKMVIPIESKFLIQPE